MANRNPRQPRGGNGRYARSTETVERDAEAARLRARGMSYPAIAKALGIFDESGAFKAVQRALQATLQEPSAAVRAVELKRLDDMWTAALGVLERLHVTVSNGRVIHVRVDGTGTYNEETGHWEGADWVALADDAPVLAAIDRLLRIQERRARLLGLDAPVKHEVRNADGIDAEIEQLMAKLGGGRQGTAPAPATPGDPTG
jgi:hypothetical protein